MIAYLTEEGQTYYLYLKAAGNFLHARRITVRYQ
jgi:hypothetical protein